MVNGEVANRVAKILKFFASELGSKLGFQKGITLGGRTPGSAFKDWGGGGGWWVYSWINK